MPNKYKVEYEVTDDYESVDETPMSLDEITNQFEPRDVPAGLIVEEFTVEKV